MKAGIAGSNPVTHPISSPRISENARIERNKLTNPDYTAIKVLVDRSGSMWNIKSDAEGALASFIDEQTKVEGKATISLSQFDTIYDNVYKSVSVNDAPAYVLEPRNGTALRDALGRAITEFGAELRALPENERPANVVFVTITDGYENSSREYSQPAVKALVKEQTEKYGWNFVFLAANQDAVLTGAEYGFLAGNSMTYDTNSAAVANTGSSLSGYVTRTRSGLIGNAFTEEERASTHSG